MDITIDMNKKNYFMCSMYYMKRYFGLRETLLLCFLLVAALLLFFLADTIIILVLFGVTMAVVLVTTALFIWTSISGYKHDTEKQGIAVEKLHFEEEALQVEFIGKTGEKIFADFYDYSKIEAVVIKKKFIYIYAAMAIFFPIMRSETGEETFLNLAQFLREHLTEDKFKFRQRKRIYPKKKKITLTPDEPEKGNKGDNKDEKKDPFDGDFSE